MTATPKAGHNSVGGIAGDQLKSVIERIERLEAEKADLAADIREVFSEAKGNGFDAKILRQVLKIRRLDRDEFQEQQTLLSLYLRAVDPELAEMME